jgi:hypothetical protein
MTYCVYTRYALGRGAKRTALSDVPERQLELVYGMARFERTGCHSCAIPHVAGGAT